MNPPCHRCRRTHALIGWHPQGYVCPPCRRIINTTKETT
jgi:hypothetical protein